MKILFVFFISTLSGAATITTEVFNSKLLITPSGYYIDGISVSKPYLCNAYGNKSEEGIKVKFKGKKGLIYALECKGSEVGSVNNLIVFLKNKKIEKVNYIAHSSGDCDYKSSSQSWIEDINSDGYPDIVKRSISSKTDTGCKGAGTGEVYEYNDSFKVFYWNKSINKFEEKRLNESTLKSYKTKYKIE